MEPFLKEPISIPNLCEWCGGTAITRCGRCHVAYYCSREHQMQHWDVHKKVCKKSLPPLLPITTSVSQSGASNLSFSPSANWCQNNMPCGISEGIGQISSNIYNPSCDIRPQKPVELNIPNEAEMLSSLSNELMSSDNNFWRLIDSCNAQNLADLDMLLGKDFAQLTETQERTSSAVVTSSSCNPPANTPDVNLISCASISHICNTVVRDMNDYGICVLDNFIGAKTGNQILQEVKNLYQAGIFKRGEVFNPRPYASNEAVRSDVITWVNGTEPGCKVIGELMKKLDLVVTTCNKMPNNGQFSKYKLHRRTKAMVACYPGNGTYYKKHIDNPHRDGRCITCIYYLNQNWDVKKHGGLLRMFPASRNSDVAQIPPIFDRMIFFWSDKRNPHEVLPAFATRFAITVWYFDADERDEALRHTRESLQSQIHSFN